MLSNNAFQYSPSLDGLRALSALVIVLYHAKMPGLTGGFLAVDVFFVLSGYLITSLLVAECRTKGALDYRRFFTRRLKRLLPAMWVFLAVYLLVSFFIFTDNTPTKHIKDALFSALYLVNYTSSYFEPVAALGHMWTLSVEMQFYLVWPLVILLLVRFKPEAALLALVLLYISATAGRWWAGELLSNPWDVYVRTHTHCSGLILGAVLALWKKRIPPYWGWVGFLVIAFAMTFYSSHWLGTVRYGFTVVEVGAALVLLSQPAWLGSRFLVWLGTMSYGVYLWHYLFVQIARQYDLEWGVTALMAGVMGLLCACISYYFIESRFYKRRVSAKSQNE